MSVLRLESESRLYGRLPPYSNAEGSLKDEPCAAASAEGEGGSRCRDTAFPIETKRPSQNCWCGGYCERRARVSAEHEQA